MRIRYRLKPQMLMTPWLGLLQRDESINEWSPFREADVSEDVLEKLRAVERGEGVMGGAIGFVEVLDAPSIAPAPVDEPDVFHEDTPVSAPLPKTRKKRGG